MRYLVALMEIKMQLFSEVSAKLELNYLLELTYIALKWRLCSVQFSYLIYTQFNTGSSMPTFFLSDN